MHRYWATAFSTAANVKLLAAWCFDSASIQVAPLCIRKQLARQEDQSNVQQVLNLNVKDLLNVRNGRCESISPMGRSRMRFGHPCFEALDGFFQAPLELLRIREGEQLVPQLLSPNSAAQSHSPALDAKLYELATA